QLEMGSKSRSFLTVIPYSISVPITLGIAIGSSSSAPSLERLEVLPRSDVLDRAPLVAVDPGDQGPDVDDPLALAPGDARPVVGIGGVRKILVLLELVAHGVDQVVELDAALLVLDEPLHGLLLGPVDDVLDHRAAREVLEVEDLALALGVRDLQELVVLGGRVHVVDRIADQPVDDLRGVAAVALLRLAVERQLRLQVLGEDVEG